MKTFSGGLQVDNRHYAATELQPWSGREVMVVIDLMDASNVQVLDGVGAHVCWASFKGVARAAVSDNEMASYLGAKVQKLKHGSVK